MFKKNVDFLMNLKTGTNINFIKTNIIDGIGSCLNIYGSNFHDRIHNDIDIIRNDWEIIGNDFEKALEIERKIYNK